MTAPQTADDDDQATRGLHALLPQVYEELRQLARMKMAQESPGQTLQATALIHEAWLRVSAENKNTDSWNRSDFVLTAALAMRRILIDRARAKQTAKRGGAWAQRDPLFESQIAAPTPEDEAVAIDDAMNDLEKEDPVAAQLVELRYFGGFTMAEAAETLGLSQRSGERLWTFARAFLRHRIEQSSS